MVITQTPTVDGKTISTYIGLVSACVLLVVPGGKKMIQTGWSNCLSEAMMELQQQAYAKKADAVVGIQVEPFRSGSFSFLSVTGTAVKFA